MRVPIRKGGEFTRIIPDPYLTSGKLSELKEKLKRLKATLPEAINEVKRLGEMGDFSENAAYQMAKGKLRGLNQRVQDLTEQIDLAIVIRTDSDQSRVRLGDKVTVKSANRQITYLILGSAEIDIKKNIISHNSPIGSALMGKKIGDIVKIPLADNIVELEIIKIA